MIPTPDELAAMTPEAFKVYDQKVRRIARRQGLEVRRSYRRDPLAIDYDKYAVTKAGSDRFIFGKLAAPGEAPVPGGKTILEVHDWLVNR